MLNKNVLNEYGDPKLYSADVYNDKGDIIDELAHETYEFALEFGLIEALKLI